MNGHGRLRDPPSRSSAWREGFKTPPDYNVKKFKSAFVDILFITNITIELGHGGILRWVRGEIPAFVFIFLIFN